MTKTEKLLAQQSASEIEAAVFTIPGADEELAQEMLKIFNENLKLQIEAYMVKGKSGEDIGVRFVGAEDVVKILKDAVEGKIEYDGMVERAKAIHQDIRETAQRREEMIERMVDQI